MFYILVFTLIHCILLYFVAVAMCVCRVDIERYLLTYLLRGAGQQARGMCPKLCLRGQCSQL